MQNNLGYNEEEVFHNLRHYLPSQAALKDFVHHNSLHAFEDLSFFDAIFKASKIFGIQVTFNLEEYRQLHNQGRIRDEIIDYVIIQQKGANVLSEWKGKMLKTQYDYNFHPRAGRIRSHWKKSYHIDLDNLVQPTLFRIIGSYLDQGIAIWHFPFEDKGLINSIKILEESSFSSFFNSSRVKKLILEPDLSIEKLLGIIVGEESYYDSYLYDQQFNHPGWSGIVATIESTPGTLLYPKNITLEDFIILELLLEIDALDVALKKNWPPFSTRIKIDPTDYFAEHKKSELEEVLQLWQLSFEWDYYDEVLSGLQFAAKSNQDRSVKKASFQSVFCVDDRECSFRRHIEDTDTNCETYGAPGYFGAAFYFQPYGGKFYEKNCPVSITPKHLIKEIDVTEKRKHEILHSKNSHKFFRGFMASLSLGVWAAFRLVYDLFNPKMQADISNAFAHMNINGSLIIESSNATENGLQIGYTIDEMTDIVDSILSGIGLKSNFASIVYVVAHGSSSANNPHHGAHDCGACSGRPGSVNARVFAFMANHPDVRKLLESRNIIIPSRTQFIGGMHDTASDEMAFYDENILSPSNINLHKRNVCVFENALDLNAKERARRFSSININQHIKHVRKAIKERSVSYFEPRPELGHGTNALCFIGSRDTIKGLFLDRRAFLQSYDYTQDKDGEVLTSVLGPLPDVCGGINLEYYFSRMDLEKMGAGTKLPHNVMGLIGVVNSSDGDLRPGLPLQMIENHDPVRLLMIIEHYPEVIKKVISKSNTMLSWFTNNWIHLVIINPETRKLFHFLNGDFVEYLPISVVDSHTDDLMKIIEGAKDMESNHILDATKENLPVYISKN